MVLFNFYTASQISLMEKKFQQQRAKSLTLTELVSEW